MKLSEHFSLEEATRSDTALRLGIDNSPNDEQLANMQVAAEGMEEVRRVLDNVPIHISSWLRCMALNKAIGGSPTGAHPDGYAIDFTAPQYGTPQEVCRAIRDSGIKFDQLIYEGTWVHISFAPKMRQQVLTAYFHAGKATYSAGVA